MAKEKEGTKSANHQKMKWLAEDDPELWEFKSGTSPGWFQNLPSSHPLGYGHSWQYKDCSCFLFKRRDNSLLSLTDFQVFSKSTELFPDIMRVLGEKQKGHGGPLEWLAIEYRLERSTLNC